MWVSRMSRPARAGLVRGRRTQGSGVQRRARRRRAGMRGVASGPTLETTGKRLTGTRMGGIGMRGVGGRARFQDDRGRAVAGARRIVTEERRGCGAGGLTR
ncbi:hypothetical protein Aca07nite_80790 [Actinoplanes capillaceus]|uniref:Uncharacterized protein n=1 Tax=Actinoplanes campanulatus TaxID=113559 RepID=A0ABQ3WX63_9ACTN|nr:hypothetical protein Aca07nite_80790 [Actinoplanes capillaceus]